VRTWLLLAIASCSGDLREKIGQSDIDATVLMTVPPPPCDPPATPSSGTGDCTGGGKPGDDCLMCHHQGAGATPFTFAGTLYTDELGSAPLAGATIHLQDEVGNQAMAITYSQGNFFSTDGYVMYPSKAFASLCPDVIGMVSPVDMSTGANCNTFGCHTAGFRIHTP